MEMIRSNKKLNFYSIFKIDVSKSEYLEQIKSSNQRNALAKLRAGNHNLRIESGRHCFPKIPEDLRICQYCSSNEIGNEIHFILYCNRFKELNRQQFTNSIKVKFTKFDLLSDHNKLNFILIFRL